MPGFYILIILLNSASIYMTRKQVRLGLPKTPACNMVVNRHLSRRRILCITRQTHRLIPIIIQSDTNTKQGIIIILQGKSERIL